MTFKEKSAWGSLIGLVLISYWYFPAAFAAANSGDHPIRLVLISVACTVALIVIEAIYHTFIAVAGGDSSDERDVLFDLRASRNASFVLGIGLFWLVGHIIASTVVPGFKQLGILSVAVWILLAITVSEVSKLAIQIWYYRAGN